MHYYRQGFIISEQGFANGMEQQALISVPLSNVKPNWWTSSMYQQLSYGKIRQLNWVRKNFMTYDYCKDYTINGHIPHECFKHNSNPNSNSNRNICQE
ncbi:putative xyloglucan endotransglucosylase/hydrolase protein [Trifolium repens]|nr:putative xyloglucan endotransglucosylase/hydrolase protein [Trifolium repens]